MKKRAFPISHIKGEKVVGEKILEHIKDSALSYNGLVEDMDIYEGNLDFSTLSPTIRDFYEDTQQYRLFAAIKWHAWFKPFAMMYRFVSRRIRQINLPLSNQSVEMTGDIVAIEERIDGRPAPRAWIRKVNGEECFVAIYSYHTLGGVTYMNIALPLPGATMTGVLKLEQHGKDLILSSYYDHGREGVQGIYLSINHHTWKLPLHEKFIVREEERGVLYAQHQMRILGIPFLTITYNIDHQSV